MYWIVHSFPSVRIRCGLPFITGCSPSTLAPISRNTSADSARGSKVAHSWCRSSHFAIFSGSTPGATYHAFFTASHRFRFVPLLVRHDQVGSLPMWNLFFHRCCLPSLTDFTLLFDRKDVFADFFRVRGRV